MKMKRGKEEISLDTRSGRMFRNNFHTKYEESLEEFEASCVVTRLQRERIETSAKGKTGDLLPLISSPGSEWPT